MLAPVLVTPVRIGLLSAVVFGFAMGIPVSLADSAVAGAVAGVTAAVVLGAIAGVAARRVLEPFADLAPADRVTVMRAVQKGRHTEPRLAREVLFYAGLVRQRNLQWVNTRTGSRIFVAIAGLQAAAAGYFAFQGEWVRAALRVPLIVGTLLIPGWVARSQERLERAETYARSMLGRR